MKGMVFTEFLELVEDKFGFEMADKIVSEAELESGGVYTAVGTYSHGEMVQLVSNLSEYSGVSIPDLLQTFGYHLFSRFSEGYGHFFSDVEDAFSFLARIDNYIHIEVKKLYPDAELPAFTISRPEESRLEMIYESERGLADFAEGLIRGCIDHFEESISINRINLHDQMKKVKFILTHN